MREQLIAIDQIEERHRLAAQRMDDVMVVDHMAMLAAALRRPAAPQGQQLRRAKKAFETRRRMKPPLDVTSTRTSS